MSDEWNLIYTYRRRQAIEDGVLIDVTGHAKEVGFKIHTVVTDRLFHGFVEPPLSLEGEGQSTEGRLHDLLWLAFLAARREPGSSRVEFDVLFLMRRGKSETVGVIADVGPGDAGEPVLTLMLAGDD